MHAALAFLFLFPNFFPGLPGLSQRHLSTCQGEYMPPAWIANARMRAVPETRYSTSKDAIEDTCHKMFPRLQYRMNACSGWVGGKLIFWLRNDENHSKQMIDYDHEANHEKQFELTGDSNPNHIGWTWTCYYAMPGA